jgi:hypothetical protein
MGRLTVFAFANCDLSHDAPEFEAASFATPPWLGAGRSQVQILSPDFMESRWAQEGDG